MPPIFTIIQTRGHIATDEMFRVFNMGIGLVVICAAQQRDEVVRRVGEAVVVGRVVEGTGITYEGTG